MAMASEDEALRLLLSPLIVERTKGVERLQRAMTDGDRRTTAPIEAAIVDRLLGGGGGGGRGVAAWEARHGALLGARAVVVHPTHRTSAVDDFEAVVRDRAVRMLDEDDEYTVRIAAGNHLYNTRNFYSAIQFTYIVPEMLLHKQMRMQLQCKC